MRSVSLIAIGWTVAAFAQQTAPPPVIFENYPQLVTPELATPFQVHALQATNQADAFSDENLTELDPLLPAEVSRADAEAKAKYADVKPGPARVGLVRNMEHLALTADAARTTLLPDGRTLYTLAVRSPGALAVRAHLVDFDVQAAELMVYGLHQGAAVARGPYAKHGPNADGQFWTSAVPGDTLFLEIVGHAPPRFGVKEILHFDRPLYPQDEDGSDEYGVLGCHLDAMCEPVNDFARRATGQMSFISGGGGFVCTGTLLNDLDDGTAVPYFLTAAHCLNTQGEVNTLDVTWLWQRASCGGALPNFNNLNVSSGGALIATQSSNDMTFIRLNGGLPAGTALAGWTTATSLDNAHGTHHPAGSWKRAVFLDSVGFCPGCLCFDGTDYDYYNMTSGLTEGGSSGSGVFNSSGQLAGQLRGICSACCSTDDFSCSTIDDYWDMYGEFEETFPAIRRFLEIGGTINVNGANTTPPWEGTPVDPFLTVGQAHSFAWNGARIRIQAGVYPEALTISKAVTLLANGGTVRIGG